MTRQTAVKSPLPVSPDSPRPPCSGFASVDSPAPLEVVTRRRRLYSPSPPPPVLAADCSIRRRRLTSAQRFFIEVCKQLPTYLSEHIKEVFNVVGDGHCGYRVVGRALNMGENWAQVRLDLANELSVKESMYVNIYGNERWQELIFSLQCTEMPAPPDKWMSMPDMGLVVASCYNIAFVFISKFQSLTFFPLNSPPPHTQRLVVMGYIDGNHFIQLVMHEGCPLPQIVCYWRRYCDPIASKWEDLYLSRLTIPDQPNNTSETVNLDLS